MIYIYIYICVVYCCSQAIPTTATLCLDDRKGPSTVWHLLSPGLFAAWLAPSKVT